MTSWRYSGNRVGSDPEGFATASSSPVIRLAIHRSAR